MAMEVICGQCSGRLLVESPGVIVACPHCGVHLSIPIPKVEKPTSAVNDLDKITAPPPPVPGPKIEQPDVRESQKSDQAASNHNAETMIHHYPRSASSRPETGSNFEVQKNAGVIQSGEGNQPKSAECNPLHLASSPSPEVKSPLETPELAEPADFPNFAEKTPDQPKQSKDIASIETSSTHDISPFAFNFGASQTAGIDDSTPVASTGLSDVPAEIQKSVEPAGLPVVPEAKRNQDFFFGDFAASEIPAVHEPSPFPFSFGSPDPAASAESTLSVSSPPIELLKVAEKTPKPVDPAAVTMDVEEKPNQSFTFGDMAPAEHPLANQASPLAMNFGAAEAEAAFPSISSVVAQSAGLPQAAEQSRSAAPAVLPVATQQQPSKPFVFQGSDSPEVPAMNDASPLGLDFGAAPSASIDESQSSPFSSSINVQDEMVGGKAGSGGSQTFLLLLLVMVLSYASLLTTYVIYLLFFNISSQLESLPDLKTVQQDGGRARVPRPENILPPGHDLKLGQSARYGNIRVTPLRVTRGPIEFAHFTGDATRHRSPSGPVLKIWLKIENVDSEQSIIPIDTTLMFFRRGVENVIAYNVIFVEADRQKKGANLFHNFDRMAPDSEFVIVGQHTNEPLGPHQSFETFIPSEEGIEELSGNLVWRIHLRKGYGSQTGNGVTTLIDVHFSSDDIQLESA